MKRQLYHIEPIYKSFIWGGRALIDHFHIKTDMENIGTIYHVIAIPGQLDNTVRETGEPLSVFYEKNPQIFQWQGKIISGPDDYNGKQWISVISAASR